ncbi:hypothetical protein LTR50_004424 [Elasticomyces elasticus]|nr:hypothetical protein LTR50_004424 [Elasticomyces elasticus]
MTEQHCSPADQETPQTQDPSHAEDGWQKRYSDLQDEYADLQDRLIERDEQWQDEWSRQSAELTCERDDLERRLDAAHARNKDHQDEIHALRGQVLDLKQSIVASTRMESQVTDHEFAQEMGTLFHEMQNWLLNHFRRGKTDTKDIPVDLIPQVEKVVPMYADFHSSGRLVLYQAVLTASIMEVFEEKLYFGIPRSGPLASLVAVTEYMKPALAAAPEYNRWRATTLNMLRKRDDPEIKMETERKVDSLTQSIGDLLRRLSGLETSEVRNSGLRGIIEHAVSISRLFRVQRAQYRYELPRSTGDSATRFDESTMQDVHGEEETELAGKPVLCAVFPSVTKLGDEQGDNLHLTNVIVKAKVFCSNVP